MTIKVIALKQHLSQTKVYYLNLTEPKNQQLYMMIFEKGELLTLTSYNTRKGQYEEVTSLFPKSFLQNLSEHIYFQINSKSYNDEEGTHRKSIL
ncbi:hypothetical protein [Metabacillus halosaccharovorans]|uniref:hypothetical protein n=1 Tax=Metabacillus halosaccharovorans TaxID=930124 RepID=UPI001C1F5750|nr:hypothetical protein [Metabacillus halosaccharovorans]MBU7591797.1 hypothetical protein [Metabacillus halosaccharovorans]